MTYTNVQTTLIIINYADDTTLISTINKFDNHSTGMNENINKELKKHP